MRHFKNQHVSQKLAYPFHSQHIVLGFAFAFYIINKKPSTSCYFKQSAEVGNKIKKFI